jgi:hypothetical protein
MRQLHVDSKWYMSQVRDLRSHKRVFLTKFHGFVSTKSCRCREGRSENKEPFSLLRPFEIDRKKRPDGDLAPCPMCQPNKYLRGSLIYLTDLKAIAAIGHCCADKDNLADARREYRERTTRDVEHDYLLEQIPLIPDYLSVLERVRPSAREAERIYRGFRNGGAGFQRPLRLIKKIGGLLALEEQLQAEIGATGPALFRSRGSNVIVQKIEFGFLRGMIAVSSEYNPVRELDRIFSAIQPHNHGVSVDALPNMSQLLIHKADASPLSNYDQQVLIIQNFRTEFPTFVVAGGKKDALGKLFNFDCYARHSHRYGPWRRGHLPIRIPLEGRHQRDCLGPRKSGIW